jgi:hypothetical protein
MRRARLLIGLFLLATVLVDVVFRRSGAEDGKGGKE